MPSFYDSLPPNPKSSFYNREPKPDSGQHRDFTPPRDLLDELLEEEEREQKTSPPHLSKQTAGTSPTPPFQPPATPVSRACSHSHALPRYNASANHSSKATAQTTPSPAPIAIETVLLLHPALQIPVPVKTALVDSFLQQGYQRLHAHCKTHTTP